MCTDVRMLVPVVVLSLAPFCLQAQTALSTVSGTVSDEQTGAPVAGANIYLANTTIGTTSDSTGTYSLKTSASGNYELTFSFVGYQRKIFALPLNPRSSHQLNVKLKPQVVNMQEVEVVSTNKKWKRDYEKFEIEFIGRTEFAEETVITNPWILDFGKDDEGRLTATAREPLIILNHALGYKIYVELDTFAWSINSEEGLYRIYPKFEELSPENDDQRQRWTQNRIKAYYGSSHHFLKSLYEDELRDNAFSLRRASNLAHLTEGETNFELLGQPGISHDRRSELEGFKLRKAIEVHFKKSVRADIEGESFSFYVEKNATIIPGNRRNIFFVDKTGSLLNPGSIIFLEDWASERVAFKLPFDFPFKLKENF